jgi:glutamate-1-semialdehyde aminotransferase
MHLFALNRGVLLTPFHNMALFCRAHSEEHVVSASVLTHANLIF